MWNSCNCFFVFTIIILLLLIWIFSLSAGICSPTEVFGSRNSAPVSQSVQSLSSVWLFVTPWTAACQASLFITNSQSLLRLKPSSGDAIQPSHLPSSPSPPAFHLSQHQGLFQWVSSSHQVAKVPEFQLQHQSSNEYSGLKCWNAKILRQVSSSDSKLLETYFQNEHVQ